VAFLIALGLALFVLPSPWGLVAVGAGAVVEVAEAVFFWKLSHRRAPAVGVDALIGAAAVVTSECRPLGQVRLKGELWQARCTEGAVEGATVRVLAIDGLLLLVEPT
jgi:membrane-bound serine protease (ClpP class)